MLTLEEELLSVEIDILHRLVNYPLDLNAMAVVTNLYRASQRLKAKMEQEILSKYNLSFTAFSILYDLWIWDSKETRELAVSAGVTVATISSIANTLEKKELCKREVDPRDRRLVKLILTEKGRAVIEELYPKFNKGEKEIVEGLSEEEQKVLTRLLRRLIRKMEGNE